MYQVVVPGDFLSEETKRAGEGTYVEEGKVYASQYGIVNVRGEIKVVPLSGKYMPSNGDVIIGKITEISFPFWIVDLASPYEARLHVSALSGIAREKIEFGNMSEYLNVDDLVVVKVMNVNVLMKIELALQEDVELRRGGRLIEIPHTKVPRVIGRSGSMIKMLKEKCNCFIFIAKNGRIWIRGKEDDMDLATTVILKIARESHTSGLTDRVAEFLDSFRKEKERELRG